MTSFKKTNSQIFSKPRPPVTPDTRYWNKLKAPVLLKEFGAINYVDFSPIEPYYFAVTCSVRVQLYNPITRNVVKNFNKFKENAYGASFRSDGKLIVAGGEEGVLRLFDVTSRSLLRVFKGHSGAVHRTFFMCDKTHLVSYSDDKTVSTWDIPCEQRLQTFASHGDYIRAGCPSPVSPNILLSGSYDNKVRMFDDRKGTDPVFVVDHGFPVETVTFLPSGGIFLSAGGNEIRVWDAFNGGQMLAKITHHHKTVTHLRVTSDGNQFLSSSLDRHVKVYSVSNYQPVHSFDYPNSVLSIGISHDNETLVAGMVDGLISVRRRETDITLDKQPKKKISARFSGDCHRQLPAADYVATTSTKWKERKYDRNFRRFEYSKALKQALRGKYHPKTVVSVLLELNRRKGLQQAVAGSDQIDVLIYFIIKYIGDYRFTRVLIDTANILLDVYGKKMDSLSRTTVNNLQKLQSRVRQEYGLTMKLATLQGALQMVLAAKTANYSDIQSNETVLEPTIAARENIVFQVS